MNSSKTLLFLCLLLLPFSVLARQPELKSTITTPIEISADTLEFNKEESTYAGRGNVEVKEGVRILKADYVLFNDATRDLLAEGHVVFQDAEDRVSCQRLQLNLETRKGIVEQGEIFIKEGNFHVTGERINKTGDSTYQIAKGGLTTCEGSPPAWSFVASDVKVTIEGYATTKSARFKILDQTVLYLPWGMFPVKTDRQSGFLIPELGRSNRYGLVARESYFWAISKEMDATFGLEYLEKRGFRPSLEFRYALAEDLKGTWNSSIIQDKDTDSTRYQITGRHEQVIGKDLGLKANINYVSDIDYLKDYGLTTTERSQNLLKSTIFAEKPLGRSLLTVETSYMKNLITKDNDTLFKYLPFISYYTESIPLIKDRLYTDFSSTLINFYRESGDKYTRFSMEPRVRLPFSFHGVNLLSSATLIEKAYLINKAYGEGTETKNRATVKVEGDANVQLLRNYKSNAFGLGDMQSLIKPQLKYTFIPDTSFKDVPSIDPYDRIYETHAVTYSLNHYLNTVSSGGTREISLFEISQTYGLSGSLSPSDMYKGSGSKFSDIEARLAIFPTKDFAIRTETQYSPSGQGLKGITNILNYNKPKEYYANISHSYTQSLTNEMFLDLGAIYKTIEAKYQLRYSFRDATWIDTLYQISYRPQCWGVTLKLVQSTRPNDTSVFLSFDLTGITTSGR